jgi:hypothetical protein
VEVMANSAAIADALIAHSRGILTRPQKEASDTLTVSVPHVMTRDTFPETIWLNVGDGEPHEVGPYKDLSELSWCGEGIDRYDVKYVRADLAAPQQHAQALPMIPTDDMCRTAREAIGIGSNVADHVWRVMAKAAREGVQQHAQAAQDDRAAHNAGYDAAQKADREMMQSNEHYRERVFNWIVELDTAAGLSRFTHSRVTGNAQAALSDEQIDEISASWHLDGRNASVTLRAFARAILAASHQPAAGK